MTDYRHGDVVWRNGSFFLVEIDRYNHRPSFVPLVAIEAPQGEPAGARLVQRTVDGEPLLVTDIGGELYAVREVQ